MDYQISTQTSEEIYNEAYSDHLLYQFVFTAPRRKLLGKQDVASRMNVHDYHLKAYSGNCSEGTITMTLSWPYGDDQHEKVIRFSGVLGYRFRDALGSVLSNLEEKMMSDFLTENEIEMAESYRSSGIPKFWRDSKDKTLAELDGAKAWKLSSSIGFEGYVIGKEVKEAEPSALSNSRP